MQRNDTDRFDNIRRANTRLAVVLVLVLIGLLAAFLEAMIGGEAAATDPARQLAPPAAGGLPALAAQEDTRFGLLFGQPDLRLP